MHPRGDLGPGWAESWHQQIVRLLERIERPPAVEDADLEVAHEEPAVAATPGDLVPLARLIGTKSADVVASVVVDDEQPPGRRATSASLIRRSVSALPPSKPAQQLTTTSARPRGNAVIDEPSKALTRAPSASSWRPRRPRPASSRTTRRPATGPSASSARGILSSRSMHASSRACSSASSRRMEKSAMAGSVPAVPVHLPRPGASRSRAHRPRIARASPGHSVTPPVQLQTQVAVGGIVEGRNGPES